MTSSKKKIMVVYDNKKRAGAEQLKQELESRKVCDVVDIYTKPKQAIEDLALNKGLVEYDYHAAYIVDDNIEYPAPPTPTTSIAPIKPIFSRFVKDREDSEEIRKAKDKAKRKTDSLKELQKQLQGMGFYQFSKQLQQIKPDARIILLTDNELNTSAKMKVFAKRKEDFESYSGFFYQADYYKREYAFCTAIEEFRFDVNYIRKPIQSYGHVARKINQLLVTGTYQVEKIYGDPNEERKAKSEKAFKKIMALDVGPYRGLGIGRIPEFRMFELYLGGGGGRYDKDITEKEHAAKIVKRLRSYEKEAKQELEKIQKHIRGWEDRFPSIVEDPSAFEVVSSTTTTTTKEKGEE